MGRCLKVAAACLVLAILLTVDTFFGLHDQLLDQIISAIAFFRTKTIMSLGAYVASYLAASLLCFPLTPFEIMSGFIFGLPHGILMDMSGRLLGAIVSFGIARLLRLLLCKRLESCCLKGSSVLKGVGAAVEEQGLRFLILFNLAYMPVAVKNYGLGIVPQVSLGQFLAAILMVEVPFASVWAFIGDRVAQQFDADGISFTNATEVRSALTGGTTGSPVGMVFLVIGILSVILVMRSVHKQVSKELDRAGLATEKNAVTTELV